MPEPGIKRKTVEPLRGFAVMVEQQIGYVNFSDVGTNGPVETAMGIIGRHLENEGIDSVLSAYSFPGPGEDETVRVQIERTGK